MTISTQILSQECEVQVAISTPFVPQYCAFSSSIVIKKIIMFNTLKGKNLAYKRYAGGIEI